jgi:hypothetical protein
MPENEAHTLVLRSLHLLHAWAVRCRTGGRGGTFTRLLVATFWEWLDGADSNFENWVPEDEECAPFSGGWAMSMLWVIHGPLFRYNAPKFDSCFSWLGIEGKMGWYISPWPLALKGRCKKSESLSSPIMWLSRMRREGRIGEDGWRCGCFWKAT